MSLQIKKVVIFIDTQENIKLSLENSYNQLVKVDKDEEMLDLMKFKQLILQMQRL